MQLAGGGIAIDVSFAAHGPRVAVTQLDDRVALVDPRRHAIVGRWRASRAGQTDGAAFSPDGQRVATVDFDGFLREWHTAGGRSALSAVKASE